MNTNNCHLDSIMHNGTVVKSSEKLAKSGVVEPVMDHH